MALKTYELHVHGVSIPHLSEVPHLRVESFEGSERMSACYHFEIEVLAEPHHNLTEALLGQRATFRMHDSPQRVVHGVLSEVVLTGARRVGDHDYASYRVHLVPRLWLLSKKKRSRVFQNRSVVEVVKQVLHDNHIAAVWFVHHSHPRREYCVQFEETDQAFLQRLMAEAGIFFFFLQPNVSLPDEVGAIANVVEGVIAHATGAPSMTGEVVVFADEAFAYQGLGDLPAALESLMKVGLAQLDQALDGALGVVGEVAGGVADAVHDLGGPDLRALTSTGSRQLQYLPDNTALTESTTDVVRSLMLSSSVKSNASCYRVYDPRRPLAALEYKEPGRGAVGRAASALGIDVPDAVYQGVEQVASVAGELGGLIGEAGHLLGGAIGHADLEVYDHHGGFLRPDWDDAPHEARRMLRSQQAERSLGRGRSRTPLMSCGRRFSLIGHPLDWVNREYAVVEVRHRARPVAGEEAAGITYDNEFVCVPANVPFLPPRPSRRNVQSCLTATVIAGGHPAEIATHTMGEVKVRFHWERAEGHHGSEHRSRTSPPSVPTDHEPASAHTSEGQSAHSTTPPNDYGTCWVRTMQAWSGTGWGSQFMPRVGMEVVVGFDGGDPDKPIVLGCVYNGTHPPPFSLPQDQSKSGIRTNSTGGGEGFNELSFEDLDNEELIYVHAERDLELKVKQDRRAVIDRDDFTTVEHEQRLTVKGAQRVRLEGGQETEVRGSRRLAVEGRHEVVTRGERTEQVSDDLNFEIGGDLSHNIRGSRHETVHRDATRTCEGSVTELVQEAMNVHVNGPHVVHSGGLAELSSDAEVLLQCGDSTLRISNNCIELASSKLVLKGEGVTVVISENDFNILADGRFQAVTDETLIQGSGAGIALSSEASINGSRVLLNSPAQADDAVEDEETEPTIIELKDQDGNPVPRQRYRVELEDGSSMTGTLDDEGRAELSLEGGAEVLFPDLGEVEAE